MKLSRGLFELQQTLHLISPSFPGGSEGKVSACNVGDPGSIPGLGRSPGEGNGSTIAWKIPWTEKPGRLHIVHGVAKSRTRLRTSLQ